MTSTSISRRGFVGALAAGAAACAGVSGVALGAEPAAENRVCKLLGIEKPVVSAIMCDLTSPELTAAVSNAGGLGVLALTTEDDVKATKGLTDKPFAVSPMIADDETAQMLKDEGVSIVLVAAGAMSPATSWDVDPTAVKFWKDAGFTVLVKALNVTLAGAKTIEEAGADVLIPVGYGAGGCGPVNRTAYPALLSEFKSEISIPMLAAGGVVDASTAAAGAAAGAEGAYCGTVFLATEESPACDAAKQAIVDTHSEDLVEIPTSFGGNHFGYVPCTRTPMSEKCLEMLSQGASIDEVTEYSGTNAQFWAAMHDGNIDDYAVGMDRAVNLITEIVPAAKVVDDIASAFVA